MNNRLRWVPLPRLGVVLALVSLMTLGFWVLTAPTSHVVRAGTTLGGPLPNISPLELTLFNTGMQPFEKVWDPVQGLGPVFTQFGCQVCHSMVINGATVLGTATTQAATLFGATNSDGSFNPLDGTTNGMPNEGGILLQPMSVQQFKANCKLAGEVIPTTPAFPVAATVIAAHQAPPLFGLGLVDNIPDSEILVQAVPKPFGVSGSANMVLDENKNLRVGHFGLKAQAADLTQISALALQHDIGVTNPISTTEDLPNGKKIPQFCSTKTQPNDNGTQMIDIYHFVLYLAPNTPGTGNSNGQVQFTNVGCAECHFPTYTTSSSVQVVEFWGPPPTLITSKALANQPVNLYSDLLLHDLGGANGDGIFLGQANGTQFRTAPLWGLSVKLNNGIGLMHDGKATSVAAAIARHGGEASTIVGNFNALSSQNQSDLIAFISSL